jgi:Icc-related predicted phosphoesterase
MKLLHATDIHTEITKYEAIVNHANSSDVDAVLVTGDFVDKDSQAFPQAFAISLNKALEQYAGPELKGAINELNFTVEKAQKMEQAGATREDLESLISEAKNIQLKIGELEKNDPNVEKIHDVALEGFRGYQTAEAKAVDQVLGKSSKPVYGVTGNHDPVWLYQAMDNVHFLDKEGSVEIKGIKFAGTPSTYESVRGIPMDDYSHLGDYVVEAMGGTVESSPEYNRLKNEDFDVLATHAGVADRIANDTMMQNQPDSIMYKLMKEKGAKLNLSGHFHGELENHLRKVDDILNLNPGSDKVYEIDMEKRANGVYVNKISVYRYNLEDVGTSSN